MSAEWRVLIVEDEPATATLHRRIVESVPNFRVVGVASSGQDAWSMATEREPDLMLLDLTLAGTSGLSLLHRLRSEGASMEVIAVTASRDARVVRAVIQRGAVDYVVKPFNARRLRQALQTFVRRATALSADALDQEALDRLRAGGRPFGPGLPKGLTAEGIDNLASALAEADAPRSAAELAERVGMARVTARRYLEYLVSTGVATVELAGGGPGRPRKLYRAASVDTH